MTVIVSCVLMGYVGEFANMKTKDANGNAVIDQPEWVNRFVVMDIMANAFRPDRILRYSAQTMHNVLQNGMFIPVTSDTGVPYSAFAMSLIDRLSAYFPDTHVQAVNRTAQVYRSTPMLASSPQNMPVTPSVSNYSHPLVRPQAHRSSSSVTTTTSSSSSFLVTPTPAPAPPAPAAAASAQPVYFLKSQPATHPQAQAQAQSPPLPPAPRKQPSLLDNLMALRESVFNKMNAPAPAPSPTPAPVSLSSDIDQDRLLNVQRLLAPHVYEKEQSERKRLRVEQ
jgi:hypothetical protein